MVKKRGAPPGNQNARKHGFYSQTLDEAEKLELEEASTLDGLDAEIAILRVKLKQLIENYPKRIDLQMQAANTLARLLRTRYSITNEQKKTLKEAITTVLKEVALPLGVKFITR